MIVKQSMDVRKIFVFLTAVAVLLLMPGGAFAASFTPLGTLPSNPSFSPGFTNGTAISADGSAVTGYGRSPLVREAFLWTKETGMVGAGSHPGRTKSSYAYSVSNGGSIVGRYDNASYDSEAFIWTKTDGFTGLGFLWGGATKWSRPYDISADGSTVVGFSTSANGLEPFKWRKETGMVGQQHLAPEGYRSGGARAVSADGSILTGLFRDPDNNATACVWNASGDWTFLGDLEGGIVCSDPASISSDGSVVVGYSDSKNGHEAFLWTEAGGMIGLGDLPGGEFGSFAMGVSDDGSIVVGDSRVANEVGGYRDRAFLWTEELGMVNLNDYLEEMGVDLNGWTLTGATGISADGLTIAGTCTNRIHNKTHEYAYILNLDPSPVPVPGAVWLLGSGLTGLAAWRRRRA